MIALGCVILGLFAAVSAQYGRPMYPQPYLPPVLQRPAMYPSMAQYSPYVAGPMSPMFGYRGGDPRFMRAMPPMDPYGFGDVDDNSNTNINYNTDAMRRSLHAAVSEGSMRA